MFEKNKARPRFYSIETDWHGDKPCSYLCLNEQEVMDLERSGGLTSMEVKKFRIRGDHPIILYRYVDDGNGGDPHYHLTGPTGKVHGVGRWLRGIGHEETSPNCNFPCNFNNTGETIPLGI